MADWKKIKYRNKRDISQRAGGDGVTTADLKWRTI